MKFTSLEISKQLQDALNKAGYEYENDFAFATHNPILGELLHIVYRDMCNPNFFAALTPAFTMCELWDMLPDRIGLYDLEIVRDKFGKCVSWYYDLVKGYPVKTVNDNPCDALAKLVIWCIENNHELNLPKI